MQFKVNKKYKKSPIQKRNIAGLFIVALDALNNRTSLSTFSKCLVLCRSYSVLFLMRDRHSKAGYLLPIL